MNASKAIMRVQYLEYLPYMSLDEAMDRTFLLLIAV